MVALEEVLARAFQCHTTVFQHTGAVGYLKRLVDVFDTGDEAEVDIDAARVTHLGTGKGFVLRPLGAAAPVVEAGGLFEYARQTGMI